MFALILQSKSRFVFILVKLNDVTALEENKNFFFAVKRLMHSKRVQKRSTKNVQSKFRTKMNKLNTILQPNTALVTATVWLCTAVYLKSAKNEHFPPK